MKPGNLTLVKVLNPADIPRDEEFIEIQTFRKRNVFFVVRCKKER